MGPRAAIRRFFRSESEASAPRGRAQALLGLGAALGAALAAFHLLGPSPAPEAGAIATVDGARIEAEDYRRNLEALEAERRAPLEPADRAHVLRRMIEEELLIGRGVAIGLARTDRGVRAAIASAMIDSILAEAASEAPGEARLRAFYAENRGYFERPARARVRSLFFAPGADGAARAAAARAALERGEAFESVRERLADRDLAALPDAALPASKLVDYLGPAAAEAALALEPGRTSDPVATPAGHYLLRALEREPARAPPFEQVRPQVEAEYARRAGDRALREYLERLRDEADVRLSPNAPR